MQITTIGLDIAKNVFQPCRFLAVPHLSRREELLAALVFSPNRSMREISASLSTGRN
jgi:hypothetical protein